MKALVLSVVAMLALTSCTPFIVSPFDPSAERPRPDADKGFAVADDVVADDRHGDMPTSS